GSAASTRSVAATTPSKRISNPAIPLNHSGKRRPPKTFTSEDRFPTTGMKTARGDLRNAPAREVMYQIPFIRRLHPILNNFSLLKSLGKGNPGDGFFCLRRDRRKGRHPGPGHEKAAGSCPCGLLPNLRRDSWALPW